MFQGLNELSTAEKSSILGGRISSGGGRDERISSGGGRDERISSGGGRDEKK